MLFVIKSEACGLSYENRRTFLVWRFSFFSRLDLDQIFCETRVVRRSAVQNKKHSAFLAQASGGGFSRYSAARVTHMHNDIITVVFIFTPFAIVRLMRLIFLCGSPASGKLTIAEILSERTGVPLFRNHPYLVIYWRISIRTS